MKRCPRCYETYDESEKFCELDGQPLLAEPTLSVPAAASTVGSLASPAPIAEVSRSPQQREVWFVGTAGVVLGIVVCVGAYLAYGLWNDDSGFKDPSAPAFAAQTRDPMPASRQAPRAEPTVSPEETATPEPEASPEPAPATAEESNTVAARLNQGPVSTGQRKRDADEADQTVIQMNDGNSVEVDAAWEDGQGIWYRRGGLVSFIESQRVKAITVRVQPKPSPITAK